MRFFTTGAQGLFCAHSRDDRLAVEVHVEQDGLRVGRLPRPLGEEHRLAVVVELLREEAALAEGGFEEVNIWMSGGLSAGRSAQVRSCRRWPRSLSQVCGNLVDRLLGKDRSR